MPAITAATCAITAAKSICGSAPATPAAPLRNTCAVLAAASRVLEGTQPVFRQSPPISPASISTTRAPICTAPAASDSPPEPAPMMQRSVVITSIYRAFRRNFSKIGRADSAANPKSGSSTGAEKITDRSGLSPRAKTSPKPAPIEVKTKVAGKIPSSVVKAKGASRMPRKAGIRLARKNGKAGTKRMISSADH